MVCVLEQEKEEKEYIQIGMQIPEDEIQQCRF